MINTFYEKLAKIAVNYSIKVKEGDRIILAGPSYAKDLILAIYAEIVKAGGHTYFLVQIEGTQEIFFRYASEKQILYVDNINKTIIREFDGMVQILSDYNPYKNSSVDPKKMAKMHSAPGNLEIMSIMSDRSSKGEFNWVIVPYPSQSLAQEAKMDLFSYFEFVEKTLFLDKDDPVGEWTKIDQKQEKIAKYLNKTDEIHIIGEDTDLMLSVKGRKWINSSGQNNLPDGEVFTGPVEDSVNGHIRFTYPGIHSGKEIENIYLEFKDGKVVNATAEKGEELLQEILKIPNADKLGEFAIGTNYGIQKFTKNMLFDEKMGGTIHCALGLGPEETGSKNRCSIHWDILKDMKLSGSKVIADSKVVYEEGEWKI
ncbi:MAG: aminopeptidase [Promethearchaeati archaeon]